jgi:hypothetical protein
LRKARHPPAASIVPPPPPRPSAGSKAGAPSTVTCVRYNGAELIRMLPDSSPEKYSTYLGIITWSVIIATILGPLKPIPSTSPSSALAYMPWYFLWFILWCCRYFGLRMVGLMSSPLERIWKKTVVT